MKKLISMVALMIMLSGIMANVASAVSTGWVKKFDWPGSDRTAWQKSEVAWAGWAYLYGASWSKTTYRNGTTPGNINEIKAQVRIQRWNGSYWYGKDAWNSNPETRYERSEVSIGHNTSVALGGPYTNDAMGYYRIANTSYRTYTRSPSI